MTTAGFTSIASNLRPRVSVHAAGCSKNFLAPSKRQAKGLTKPEPISGEPKDWKEARAQLFAQLKEEGREDIAITVCPCAKEA
jgi:hypothetical protein